MTPNVLPKNSRRARALGVGVHWQLIRVSLMRDLNLGVCKSRSYFKTKKAIFKGFICRVL